MSEKLNTLIVQLSDPHIREPQRLAYRRINTADYLAKNINAINKLPQTPNAVVITGDLTDFGRPEEYQHLADLLKKLPMPVYLLPGNHDNHAELRKAFPTHTYLGKSSFIQYAVDIHDLHLIALDSTTHHESYGTLCKQRLAWLEQALEESKHKPVIIALHHPPFDSLIGHMDKQGLLEGRDAFEELVAQYPNVVRVIAGHVHRDIQTSFAGTIASTISSPAHSVYLDLNEDAPSQWSLEPSTYQLLALTNSHRLLGHIASGEAFDGAYPFYEPDGKLID